MSNRAKSFKFKSPVGSNGRPRYSLPGVPRRDLDERDIARLSSEDYEAVKAAKMPDGKPLYVAPKERKAKDDEPDDATDEAVADEVDDAPADEDDETFVAVDRAPDDGA